MLVGVGIGAVAVQTLHAQGKAPVYFIAEVDVTNQDAYIKEFLPLAQAATKSSGDYQALIEAMLKLSRKPARRRRRVFVTKYR